MHAEHGRPHTLDSDDVEARLESSEPEEVKVGKKRQIIGILVSISFAQGVRGLIYYPGFAIRHHDPFDRHRSDTSNNYGLRVQCVVSFSRLDWYVEPKCHCSVTSRGYYLPPAF
jgi:hypothetical protein